MIKLWYRCYLVACAITMIGWIVYALAKQRVAAVLAGRFGEALLKVGQGKFRDANVFVQNRLYEALWLATLALLFIAAQWLFNRLACARIGRERWAAQGLAGFILLNLWIGAATNTALFWGVMGAGAGVQNLMQFHFKRILAAENPIKSRAVLVGSSQTRAEIDEDLLNTLLGTKLWTTELHFPGSHGYDLLLIERQLKRANPQFVICYLSEGYFYNGSHGETPPNFLGLIDVREGWRLGAQHYLSKEEILSGLLGDTLPLFRCREVIAQRVFGLTTVELKQQQYDMSLQSDLDARAQEIALGFRINQESEFQKQAFEAFVARCQHANRRILLLKGGYNPILEHRIESSVHADMLNFLKQLEGRYSLVTVVPGTDLAEQTSADYDDLNHVNKETQQRFTTGVARLLAGFLGEGKVKQ